MSETDKEYQPWFYRESPWYKRIGTSFIFLVGLGIVVYAIHLFITVRNHLSDYTAGPVNLIITSMTVFGLVFMVLSGPQVIKAFKTNDGMSHIRAAKLFLIFSICLAIFITLCQLNGELLLKLVVMCRDDCA